MGNIGARGSETIDGFDQPQIDAGKLVQVSMENNKNFFIYIYIYMHIIYIIKYTLIYMYK